MIKTILVEDDLYIQKHFTERINAEAGFQLAGVFRMRLKPKSIATVRCGSS